MEFHIPWVGIRFVPGLVNQIGINKEKGFDKCGHTYTHTQQV